MWDAQDGTHGTKNYILRAIEHLKDGFLQRLSSEFEWEHQEFHQFCELAFNKSVMALEEFCAELSDFNRNLLSKAHGEPPHSKDQEKEVWPLVLILPMVYWEEVSKVRSCAKRLKSMDPLTATASMMWAVVQAHGKHAEFKAARFREHPRINPKVLNYLFERCANKRDVTGLRTSQASLAASVGAVKATTEQLKTQVDRLATKVGGAKAGRQEGEGGGYGGQQRNRRFAAQGGGAGKPRGDDQPRQE
jgi:hypothetical protein